MFKVEKATGFMLLFIKIAKLFNFNVAAFINVFNKKIYSRTGYINTKLYLHEKKHLAQLKKDGLLKFSFLYLYYNIRYGYKQNPYEIEARQAEAQNDYIY